MEGEGRRWVGIGSAGTASARTATANTQAAHVRITAGWRSGFYVEEHYGRVLPERILFVVGCLGIAHGALQTVAAALLERGFAQRIICAALEQIAEPLKVSDMSEFQL